MTKTIKWEMDFDRVLTLARTENKMVLLEKPRNLGLQAKPPSTRLSDADLVAGFHAG